MRRIGEESCRGVEAVAGACCVEGRRIGSAEYSVDGAPQGKLSGDQIRAKIAANRDKRLRIAEAMKRAAGVTEHTINTEDFRGLAYIGTGRIVSPEGRNIRELYIVAHECGHIFLHNSGPGYDLPTHIKEMEAESYAHQAFRHHGMIMPRRLSKWGRSYVGSWIAKDRAAGIPIDSRAEAYACGGRSPYEPLRMVPLEWRLRDRETDRLSVAVLIALRIRSWRRWWAEVCKTEPVREAQALFALAFVTTINGTALMFLALRLLQAFYPDLAPVQGRGGELSWGTAWLAWTGGLISADLVVLWKTITS